ncbi:hypothetical protein HELRODRAFT_70692, partial [Helobdella robusta]|uniref:tRNA pseudouridine(55) synthase n=1 Tax=Helobdella robusta TaxID=6412 RepID=T1G0A8_HELRO
LLKVGHGGTLDKDAHGVLAVGVGNGCKHLTKLLHGPKASFSNFSLNKYLCTTVLGIETDTCYITGNKINEKPFDHVTKEMLEHALLKFVGTTLQVPPIYSALKFQGRRLSDMAYAGETIPVEKLLARKVDVFDIRCIHFQLPTFTLDISCGPGFYVRSLVKDLAHEMNTCGYVGGLERTRHGIFVKEHALTESQWNYASVIKSINFFRFHWK